MINLIDLHVHSNISDGTFSPEEVVLLAKEAGLSAFSLTDHDSIDGVSRCMVEGIKQGIEIIPGIELSGDYQGHEIHILGYFVDIDSALLKSTLVNLIHDREARNDEMIAKLNALGFELTLDDLGDPKDKAVLTRAHFARAMMNKGYIKAMDEAFSKYIGDGCPAFIPKRSLTFKECIDLIHNCGGLAVLAHPMLYKFATGNVKGLISDLKAHGIDGVEVIYSKHSPEDTAMLKAFCKAQDLFITGGSDFHGANKPSIQVGIGQGSLQIPSTLLDIMKERLEAKA